MKLYMVRHNNKDSMAVSDDGRNFKILTLSKFAPNSFSCIEEFLEGSSLEELRNFIRREDLDDIVVNEENILPPISKPKQNIMCMGLNYEDHIKESERVFLKDIKRPKYPIIFTKSILSINAPYGNIELRDEVSCELDWESELAVVIGNPGIRIKKDDAYNHVFGYTVLNDISARDIQRNHKQFFLGKSLPGACPIGPCIVTKDEIDNPHNLDIFCRVNGQIKQESNTKFQIFDIPSQIEAISKSTYLMPGDIIATGTPSGVGFARKPPEFLKDGDIVECEVEKIGKIINKVIDCSHQ